VDRLERGNEPIVVQAREIAPEVEDDGKGLSKKVREHFKGNMDAARQALFPEMKSATFSSKWYGSRPWLGNEVSHVHIVLASV
jgi:hypothetical protein